MKKIFLTAALIIAGAVCLPRNDFAADGAEELKLYVGQITPIAAHNPTRIVIGNPAIIDVTDVAKDRMTLNPKATGKTTLVFWDNFGENSYEVNVFAENMQEYKKRVDNLIGKLNLPEVYAQVSDEENKVLILGRIKSSQDRERLFTALGLLKDKITDLLIVKEEEAVIEINVQVLELNKDATNTLGFSFPGSLNLLEVGSPGIGALGSKVSTLFTVNKLQRATYTSGAAAADPFTFKLDALVEEGKARILSRPRLTCQSGKEAELLVGGEKPTFTTAAQSTVGTSTQVEYKEFGIKLKMKPIVTAESRIKISLNMEVSEVGAAEIIGAVTAPTAKAYPLTKRSASTELILDDGQAMVIGGLIKQKTEEDIRKTPILGDVPVLGFFFRKSTVKKGGGQGERGDSELYIILTPTIVARDRGAIKEEKTETAVAGVKYPAEGNAPGPLEQYARIVQKRIMDNLSYPAGARESGFQGTVKLSLRLSYTGQLLDVFVKEPSDYKILDDNAVTVAKMIPSYPPFPASIEQKELSVDIPIIYHLD